MINKRIILNILGLSIFIEGLFMLFPILVSLIYQENDLKTNVFAFLITTVTGFLLWMSTRVPENEIGKRDAYLIVPTVWIMFSLFGALPLYLGGYVHGYTNAFFETMSGFTTTGASVIANVEALPHGVLFWRSLTHLLGGIGILIMFIAILPFLGVGGSQLFQVESVGFTVNKLRPRVRATARALWIIYLSLVFAETIFLILGKMPVFDALCHSFGTIATGGFSTKNNSIAAYSPYIQYVIIIFMILAGTNFTLHMQMARGEWKAPFRNPEFRLYLIFLVTAGLFITALIIIFHDDKPSSAFRDAFFQTTSILTCTGFSTVDYMKWSHQLWFFIFLLMFIGGSSGSTAGGIKVARYLLFFKNMRLQFQRLLHPKAVFSLKIGDLTVTNELMSRTFAFFVAYMFTFAIGTLILHFNGLDTASAMGAVATTMGGIGPGLGSVGPASTYAAVPLFGKWVLSALMLLGRLELFAIMILFSRVFWSNK
ncbi:MAG: TrkH family potassium uptake protein [Chlorobi bacterium]|nr:TrkH family potassium uptake protein [Chlorobiota bacterium]